MMKNETKKIGILTFNSALNYGAVLQAFALKQECEMLGYETHVINYCPKYIERDESVAPIKKFITSKNKQKAVYSLLSGLLSYYGNKKREKNFKKFRSEYLDESILCRTKDDVINLKYDIYISGSDQIWNYKITDDSFDPIFFLNIEMNSKKIIYAASSHDTPFSREFEESFSKILLESQIPISIRERELANYTFKLTGKQYPIVLDPTLLSGINFINKIRIPNLKLNRYILLYQIDSNPESDICVRSLENRFNRKVYTMCVPHIGNRHGRIGNIGPEDFLAFLAGADFLVTNSFHGVALALIFHKQFFVYENKGVMSRINELLNLTCLNYLKVTFVSDIDEKKTINYEQVDKILNEKREESLQFLVSSLD